jgi:hypothetical protein
MRDEKHPQLYPPTTWISKTITCGTNHLSTLGPETSSIPSLCVWNVDEPLKTSDGLIPNLGDAQLDPRLNCVHLPVCSFFRWSSFIRRWGTFIWEIADWNWSIYKSSRNKASNSLLLLLVVISYFLRQYSECKLQQSHVCFKKLFPCANLRDHEWQDTLSLCHLKTPSLVSPTELMYLISPHRWFVVQYLKTFN